MPMEAHMEVWARGLSTLAQMARGNPREGGEEEEDSGKKPHVERGV